MPKKKPGIPERVRDFAAEYSRRIARGLKIGRSKQQARGHKVKEHVSRHEREREQYGGLAGDEIRSIRRWYGNSFNPRNDKEQPSLDALIDWVRSHDYISFQAYRDRWNDIRRTYLRELRRGTYEPRGLNYLREQAGIIGNDLPDIKWLYYH